MNTRTFEEEFLFRPIPDTFVVGGIYKVRCAAIGCTKDEFLQLGDEVLVLEFNQDEGMLKVLHIAEEKIYRVQPDLVIHNHMSIWVEVPT